MKVSRLFTRYRRDETGAVTVEAALWLPFFIIFLFGIVEMALVFHGQSRMLQIAQDANRAFSVGRFASPEETATWTAEALGPFSDEIATFTTLNKGVIYTGVSIPAADLAGNIGVFSVLFDIDIRVIAQQVLEY